MLITIEKVFTKEEVAQVRQLMDKADWIDGRVTAGSQAAQIKSNEQLDDNSELAVDLGHKILSKLGQHPLFMSAAVPKTFFPPKFNRYSNGGHYGTHVDNAVMTHRQTGQFMRTDLSATLFFCEPDEYEGGELMIETSYGAQEVKLEAGDMVLYPSNSLHQVMPVTSGSRVCSFIWLQSMVRDNEKREMLFDLDQSIQTLSVERGSNDPEVKRLTTVYHNLVRTWAET